MDPLDYYATLGLAPGASSSEIKKAYRKLAIRWHPDKNPDNHEEASEKFKVINAAYECLGDVDRKRRYDEGDVGGSSDSGGADFGFHYQAGFDPFRVFRSFFGGHDPFEAMHQMHQDAMRAAFGRHGHSQREAGGSTGHHIGNRGWQGSASPFSSFFGRDPFDDPFFTRGFEGGFGGIGGSNSLMLGEGFGSPGATFSSSSSSFSSAGSGYSKSVSTSSTIGSDGKRRTITKTTIRHPDGRVETDTTETVDDIPQLQGRQQRQLDAPPLHSNHKAVVDAPSQGNAFERR